MDEEEWNHIIRLSTLRNIDSNTSSHEAYILADWVSRWEERNHPEEEQ